MRSWWFGVLVVGVLACKGESSPPEPVPDPPPGPVTRENLLPGDPTWRQGIPAGPGEIEGYASRVSALPGEEVAFFVSTSEAAEFTWTLFRLGWYGGAGARPLLQGTSQAAPQGPCPPAPDTALIRCRWTETFRLVVPHEALSGLYLVRMEQSDGPFRFVPLVVREERFSHLLLQASTNTYQAYNECGGTSLYVDRTGTSAVGRAFQVSFDRPYDDDDGAGQMLRYDYKLAAFLERHGYDVTYTTNEDVSREGLSHMGPGQAFLSVGHDEYWTGEERATLEDARDRGVSLLFFGANTGYWKSRLEDGGRVLTSYKAHGSSMDPMARVPDATGLFRSENIGSPENALLGIMYEGWMVHSFPLVVEDEKHFLFRGTGLERGDRIPWIVGLEYDRSFDNGRSPEGLRIAARSPVLDVVGMPGKAETTTYRAKSGALVFGSGTIEWVFGLGENGIEDPRLARMTANLIAEATSVPLPRDLARPLTPIQPPESRGASDVAAEGIEAPTDLAILPDGSVVVSDSRNHRIHRLQGARVEVVAGDGEPSSDPAFDDVPGPAARFFGPTGIATIGSEIFVADTQNHCIRKIDTRGMVTTLAGALGENGDVDGAGASARFDFPIGLAFDPGRRMLLVADSVNRKIRAIDPNSGEVMTLAGGGPFPIDGPADQTAFSQPTAIGVSPNGDIFVVDTRGRSIWRISPDDLATRIVVGRQGEPADGNGLDATLSPQGGAVWDGQSLLVSEPSQAQIRRIFPGTGPEDTRVETVAGPGPRGRGDRPFGAPLGLAIDDRGRIWLADPATGSIRTLTF